MCTLSFLLLARKTLIRFTYCTCVAELQYLIIESEIYILSIIVQLYISAATQYRRSIYILMITIINMPIYFTYLLDDHRLWQQHSFVYYSNNIRDLLLVLDRLAISNNGIAMNENYALRLSINNSLIYLNLLISI